MAAFPASVAVVAWMPYFVDMDQTIITIYAGVEAEAFTFHRILLSAVSHKFQAQFEGGFEEETSKQLNLPHESSRTIAIFQNWLYSGYLTLPVDSTANVQRWEEAVFDEYGSQVPNQVLTAPKCTGCNGLRLPEAEGIKDAVPWQEELLLLLQFADIHGIPLLTREIVITWQHMDEVLNSITPYEIILSAFGILSSGAEFLKYFIEQYRFCKGADWDKCQCDCGFEPTEKFPVPPSAADLPNEFKDEIATMLRGNQYFEWCDFHEHQGVTEIGLCQQLRWEQGRYGQAELFVLDKIAEMNYDSDEGLYDNTTPGQWY